MKLNLKVRFKNPLFIVQLVMAVLLPILAHLGITVEDLTTWSVLWSALLEAVKSPYVIGLIIVSVWNALNDPTTKGFGDSEQALTYKNPS